MPDDLRAQVRAWPPRSSGPIAALAVRAGDASPAVRMRVHLARALALGPEVLLMEHPTVVADRAMMRSRTLSWSGACRTRAV